MYGLLGLLPTSGENFMSTAPLEIYLLRKMVTCLILILPAVCMYVCTVSHKSKYTPHISAINLVYIFKGQYYRNETWIYFRVVNVQLV